MVDWTKIKYFSAKDNWGDVSKVDSRLIYLLDEFRAFVGQPFIIHCAYERSGHTPNSQHYVGKAVDGHFKNLNWLDQYLMALKFGKFRGIGVYPDWNNPGLHLDIRDAEYTATWMQLDKKYITVDFQNIKRALKKYNAI